MFRKAFIVTAGRAGEFNGVLCIWGNWKIAGVHNGFPGAFGADHEDVVLQEVGEMRLVAVFVPQVHLRNDL